MTRFFDPIGITDLKAQYAMLCLYFILSMFNYLYSLTVTYFTIFQLFLCHPENFCFSDIYLTYMIII